ncbi:MAG: SpoIID/LytB domain-containing protein [Ignavibacteriaceae bacterium]
MKKQQYYFYILFIISLTIVSGCSSSSRFTSDNDNEPGRNTFEGNSIRVLLENPTNYFTWTVEEPVIVSVDGITKAIVNSGNNLRFGSEGDETEVSINRRNFSGKEIRISSKDNKNSIDFKGKVYRGSIKIKTNNGQLVFVNSLSLEDYLKGVLPLEMPAGKGNENFEALKAFAICARTYSINKMDENKLSFDVYLDTRDQVYGGLNSEKEITNKAVNATMGEILTFKGKPAVTFYSASCGGHTENIKNVFNTAGDLPYLSGVKDGDEPYCSITPRFNWEETYSENQFINRLINSGLISGSDFNIENIEVASRFESGRVNELRITLSSDGDEKEVSIFGNNIRSVIRTSDNKGILRSTMFYISYEDDTVTITGKGYGHGVGLCQWGCIDLSHEGWNYKSILNHYFPGTEIERIKK